MGRNRDEVDAVIRKVSSGGGSFSVRDGKLRAHIQSGWMTDKRREKLRRFRAGIAWVLSGEIIFPLNRDDIRILKRLWAEESATDMPGKCVNCDWLILRGDGIDRSLCGYYLSGKGRPSARPLCEYSGRPCGAG